MRDRVSVVLMQLETPIEVLQRVAALGPELGLPLILDPAPAPTSPLPDDVWSRRAPDQAERARGLDDHRNIRPGRRSRPSRPGAGSSTAAYAPRSVTLGERGAVLLEADAVTELLGLPR